MSNTADDLAHLAMLYAKAADSGKPYSTQSIYTLKLKKELQKIDNHEDKEQVLAFMLLVITEDRHRRFFYLNLGLDDPHYQGDDEL